MDADAKMLATIRKNGRYPHRPDRIEDREGKCSRNANMSTIAVEGNPSASNGSGRVSEFSILPFRAWARCFRTLSRVDLGRFVPLRIGNEGFETKTRIEMEPGLTRNDRMVRS